MSYEVKGWCPGAHRPMMSGDGLVVRVRPRLAELSIPQALGLCAAAQQFGAGLIDLTNRANLQVRGVSPTAWPDLMAALEGLALLDGDADTEARRNILSAPLWASGDDTQRIAGALTDRLAELPALPPKTGFAIDAGTGPMLGDVSADFRIERGADGGLILRAEGRGLGAPLAPGTEVDALIALAEWFVASGGTQAGRMARHTASLPGWARGTLAPAAARGPLAPGAGPLGAVHGAGFGQVRAKDLAAALKASRARALRITPWRTMILVGADPAAQPGLIWNPDAAELRLDACPGAPFCPQSSIETRGLALDLAAAVAGTLHVSGCAKGCARPRVADVVVTGREDLYDLSFKGRAGDHPAHRGLTKSQLLHQLGAV